MSRASCALGLLGMLVSIQGRAQTVASTVRADGGQKGALVTVDAEQISLEDALTTIARQAHLRLVVPSDGLPAARHLTVHVHDVSAADAFARVLDGTGLTASIAMGNVLLRTDENAAQGIVAGVVIDGHTKQPVRGATVSLDDVKKGVVTDKDGKFRITDVAPGTHVVRVRMIGYGRASQNVDVANDQIASATIALARSTTTLDQVVVTGTVVPTELKAIPNAITVITAKQLQDRGITRIDQLFRGDVPGLFTQRQGAASVSWTDGVPGTADISARGSTEMGAGHESMKIYVDGVELANRAYVGMIDPTAIERIEIISGPQASTIYGSNAINGVIQIFTKRGLSPRPEFTAAIRSAWTQNNLNSMLSPNHTADVSLSAVDGRMSYNVGGSWNYTGSWTPGVREQRLSGFAGERMTFGRLTLDGNLRVMQDGNLSRDGGDLRPVIEGIISGNGDQVIGGGSAPVITHGTSTDRAGGVTGTFALTSWWSHTVTLGADQSTAFVDGLGKAFSYPGDSTSFLRRIGYGRFTAGYNTTVQLPLSGLAKAVVTVGVDESHGTNNTVYGSYVRSNGDYRPTYPWTYGQSQAHEHGGFLQSQVGVWDALFLTYGLRAVVNPNIGRNENPNWEPRYGMALSHEFGAITAKIRASYGTATRPPVIGSKDAVHEGPPWGMYSIRNYGTDIRKIANPNLVPESQQGGEGGLEMYVGSFGSIQLTRYNQTVDNLIVEPRVDSLPFTPEFMALYGQYVQNNPWRNPYFQTQSLNIGSVRNQGWEARGTMNLWLLNIAGTYSWTKSRVIGITPKYRGQFPYYRVGAPISLFPEHTYALEFAYVNKGTRVSYNIQGQASWQSYGAFFWERTGNQYATRLSTLNSRINLPDAFTEVRPGYLLGDLNVSHQLTSHIEGLLQINNLTNGYQSEVDPYTLQSGRTTGIGFRLHW